MYFKRVQILPLPWKDLIRQVKTEEGGWEGWTSPAFWCGFLPLFTLFYVATPLTAETFPTSVALSAFQSEQSRGREGDGRSSRGSSSSRPGGRSFRRHLRVGSRESGSSEGWDPLQRALAEVLKRLHLVRPGLPSPLLLAIQPTSKVLTQEDKGSNCWEETWATDMTSLQLLGFCRWGSILREFVNQRTLTLQFRLAGNLSCRESAVHSIMKQAPRWNLLSLTEDSISNWCFRWSLQLDWRCSFWFCFVSFFLFKAHVL